MVRQTVDAIYENGVLRPLTPLAGVPEHGAVRITVTEATANGARQSFADCVGTLPDADAQEMSKAIEREFERVDPNEWK